jgi:hypothetical protein
MSELCKKGLREVPGPACPARPGKPLPSPAASPRENPCKIRCTGRIWWVPGVAAC